jgi:DNA-binding NarL/FixJ family response regulator
LRCMIENRTATIFDNIRPWRATLMIRVLGVDDHPLMMAGIAGAIDAQADMKMVGVAHDGASGVALFRELQPEVTLMDLRMPDMSGIDAITDIRAEYPSARIIVLTTSAGDIQVLRAFKAGASGYLLKNLVRTELIDTIRRVHAGKRVMPSELASELAAHMGESPITPRELLVLRGIAEGASNRRIGATLNITEHTVKGHLKNILAKLDARDRAHAVVIALKRGILDL